MSATLSESMRKARKTHHCNVCYGTIGVGDTYSIQTNVDSGDLWEFKSHLLCRSAFNLAWTPMHDFDDNPYWDEEIAPLVDSFFANLASWFTIGSEEV